MKRMYLHLGLIALLMAGSVQAQSLLTGVGSAFCASKGGRFTPTNTAGVGPEVGECFIQASLPTTPSAPRSGSAATLGAAARTAGALGNFLNALDQFNQTNAGGCQAVSGECAQSNVDAMTFENYAVETIPDTEGLNIYLADIDFPGKATFRTYAMLGDLGRMPHLALRIAEACAGSLGVVQLVCVNGAMTEALIKYSPAVGEQCGKLEDPMRGICAARVQMEQVGIKPGECVGNCPLRLRLEARLNSAQD